MGKELTPSKHHAIDEGKQEVDGSAAQERPDGGGLVEDDGRRARGARGRVLASRVVFTVGVYGDARFGQRVGVI